MMGVVGYIRKLFGFCEDTPAIRSNFKRDRVDEGFSEDDSPAFKRPKQLLNTKFPSTMASNDRWEKDDKISKVRYVPIQLEAGNSSTSTPIENTTKLGGRVRTVPIQLVEVKNNTSTPSRKPSNYLPSRAALHAVLEDDDDDNEVTLVEAKPEVKGKPKIFVNLDDYEDDENEVKNDDDVILVRKVKPAAKPYQCFITNSNSSDVTDSDQPVYYKLRKLNPKNSTSLKTYNKFVGPSGITKSYRKAPTPISRCMKGSKTMNLSNKYPSMNGNCRSGISHLFDLDQKRNYQDLIKRVASVTKPAPFGRPIEIIDLVDDMATFRNTQRAQKKALQEINLVEKGLGTEEKVENLTTEYDPITVASINSSDSDPDIVPSETSTSSSIRINPINTLKDSFRDKAVTSKTWLPDTNTKYEKKKQDAKAKVEQAKKQSEIISRVNSKQLMAHLEHKMKYELCIPESLYEEPPPTEEFPPLTPEQNRLVDRAFALGPSGDVLADKFALRVHRRDIQTLDGLNWLNDEVINYYMNLIMQRSAERPELPRVYATNTFFYPKLKLGGQAGMRRWTRRVDLFAQDLVIIPIHLGVHWCVSLVDLRARRLRYLDSMGARNAQCLALLMQYLRDEHRDKKGTPFDETGWKAECLKDIPQQMNGSDCGMFACTYAEFSARAAPYTFSQADMPYLRRKMALEILTGKLLL